MAATCSYMSEKNTSQTIRAGGPARQKDAATVAASAVDIGVGGQGPLGIPEGGMEMEPTHMGDDGGVDDISWVHPYAVGSPSFPQGWTSRGVMNQGRGSKEEVGESLNAAEQRRAKQSRPVAAIGPRRSTVVSVVSAFLLLGPKVLWAWLVRQYEKWYGLVLLRSVRKLHLRHAGKSSGQSVRIEMG